MTTNMLQWNPTASNQENDAAYLADSQRTGGATNPSVFQSVLANKLFYQVTTYLTALFTAFSNKGFSTSDLNLGTLTAQCANFLTTADVHPGAQLVPYAPLLAFDAAHYDGFQVVLSGNLSFTVSSPTPGQRIALVFTQDVAGGHNVTFPSTVKNPGSVSTAAGTTSIQYFIVLFDNQLYPLGPMTVI